MSFVKISNVTVIVVDYGNSHKWVRQQKAKAEPFHFSYKLRIETEIVKNQTRIQCWKSNLSDFTYVNSWNVPQLINKCSSILTVMPCSWTEAKGVERLHNIVIILFDHTVLLLFSTNFLFGYARNSNLDKASRDNKFLTPICWLINKSN